MQGSSSFGSGTTPGSTQGASAQGNPGAQGPSVAAQSFMATSTAARDGGLNPETSTTSTGVPSEHIYPFS